MCFLMGQQAVLRYSRLGWRDRPTGQNLALEKRDMGKQFPGELKLSAEGKPNVCVLSIGVGCIHLLSEAICIEFPFPRQ